MPVTGKALSARSIMKHSDSPPTDKESNDRTVRHVERVLDALRRGESAVLTDSGQQLAFAAAESLADQALAHLQAAGEPVLVLPASRAQALGLETASSVLACSLPNAALDAEFLAALIDPLVNVVKSDTMKARSATAMERAALACAKLATLLPAVLAVEGSHALGKDRPTVSVAELHSYKEALALALRPVSRAKVPLQDAPDTEIIAFRPQFGGKEHLALVIGTPDRDAPLVRLHSSCITGDMLESLRCDCGAQLRQSIIAMEKAGGGIVLYLTQEGRGIGIANKLRAYALQDAGLDTVEANEALGFDADERHFQPAAEMLRQLGYTSVRLMTNNPRKVAELERFGIAITERVPLVIPSGTHNAHYLDTKNKRMGHLP